MVSVVNDMFYLWFFRAGPTLPCRESWCPQKEGLTFYHIFTLRFSQPFCLQGFVQPAEVRDTLEDFWLEAGSLIQKTQLFFPVALSSAEFGAAWHGTILMWHCRLSGDLSAKLLVCTELQWGDAED